MKHNSEQLRKHAKQLILKVRFFLFSEHALKNNLDRPLSLTENIECFNVVQGGFLDEINSVHKKLSCSYTNSYCNKNDFYTLICGVFDEECSTCVANVYKDD